MEGYGDEEGNTESSHTDETTDKSDLLRPPKQRAPSQSSRVVEWRLFSQIEMVGITFGYKNTTNAILFFLLNSKEKVARKRAFTVHLTLFEILVVYPV